MAAKRKRLIVKVNRKRWCRGTGDGGDKSGLLLANGKMCCIGFACRAAGLAPRAIKGCGIVSDLPSASISKVRGALHCDDYGDAAWLEQAYTINDLALFTDARREKELTALGAKNGVTFKFVG